MRVVDTCGWIEWLSDGALAADYAPYLDVPEDVLVPTVVLYEVARWVRRERGGETAAYVVAALRRCQVVPLSEEVALRAVDLAAEAGLHMADAFVYAHARHAGVRVLTSDAAFDGLADVEFLAKP